MYNVSSVVLAAKRTNNKSQHKFKLQLSSSFFKLIIIYLLNKYNIAVNTKQSVCILYSQSLTHNKFTTM